MIMIYGSAGSRAARCLWALEELSLPYEQKGVDKPDKSGRSAEYLAINPSGKVPLLVDGDLIISQSYAINLYLARQYGRGSLWPADRVGQAAGLQWSFWVATETEPHIATLYVEQFAKPPGQQNTDAIGGANASMAGHMKFLDAALAHSPYLGGRQFTIADLNVACGLRNAAKLKVDLTPFPKVSHWLGACLGRDAQMKVAAMPQN
jgi:glutathione S-transferase